ncbi:O-glucosyltransferase rumi-like protein [Hypsibius exemplaris]|uniref:O-glucosyltransferase rumi-like protein n=1 Tax=Hypsibius exemplaris TaxID=2072580 RepID=A0A1W0WV86_HYPEX|nr:O-glucosyltransferase rumi-like protein [Hypsibius exemplaris]
MALKLLYLFVLIACILTGVNVATFAQEDCERGEENAKGECSFVNDETNNSPHRDFSSDADFQLQKEDAGPSHSVWTAENHAVDSLRKKWDRYFGLINQALVTYIPCGVSPSDAATCFADVIDADLKPYQNSVGITAEMMRRALPRGILYQVRGHRLYRQMDCLFPARCAGVEHFLLGLVSDLPEMELVVNVRDNPQVSAHEAAPFPVFSFSKNADYQDILYPAWTFWTGGPAIVSYPRGLGRWDLMRERIDAAAEKVPWEEKLPIGFFRGSRTSAERDPLVLLSRTRPDLLDVKYTKNQAWRSLKDSLGEEPAAEVSLENHCQYKYLFNFRGVAASFRLKHLFLCESVVFNVDSDWIEFFYPGLKPWVHYIPVRTDLSDVEELLEFAKDNDALARQIASRGKEFIFRHLRMEHVEAYWRKLLQEYGTLQRFPIEKRDSLLEIRA